jgi:TonB family protein
LSKAPAEPIRENSELELEELDSHLESMWQSEPEFSPQPLPRHSAFHREPEQEFGDQSVEPEVFNTRPLQEFKKEFVGQSSEPEAAVGQGFWMAEPEVAPQKLENPAADAEMVRAIRAHDRLEQTGFEPAPILQQEERPRRGVTLRPKPQKARVGYVVAVTCLGTLLVAAAIIGVATKSTGKAGVGDVASLAPESQQVDAKSEERSAAESTGPFLVEVLDTSSRRSVLLFTGDSRQDVSVSEVQRPALSAVSEISRDPIVEERPPVTTAKRQPLRDFTLAAPHPSSGTGLSAAGSDALPAPAIGEAPLAADVPLRANLPSPAAPVERTLPVGGEVQPARLIRAVLPAYPQLAKSNRVAGDVTLDALIDASGNVNDVSVISGPVFLREAAKVALKQWKYEPARLDGKPTAMHLTVTVKFKNDQK